MVTKPPREPWPGARSALSAVTQHDFIARIRCIPNSGIGIGPVPVE